MTTRARYKTQCRVLLVSDKGGADQATNSPGFDDISADVIQVSTSKTITSPGQASITLVPRRDYLNLVFPNDVICVYFSRGVTDANETPALVKSFYGFVDSVRRSITTDEKGATQTRITITCSDFQKVFQSVVLYTNAFITDAHKGALKQFNNFLGGVQLFTQGLRLEGTPASIVNALILNLLGFGGQWQLPRNHPLPPEKTRDITKKPELLKFEYNLDVAGNGDAKLVSQQRLSEADKEAAKNARTFLDLLDRRYIEVKAVDGFTIETPFFVAEGTLWDLMQSFANIPINELFCDLRLDPDWTGVPIEAGIKTGGPIGNLGGGATVVQARSTDIAGETTQQLETDESSIFVKSAKQAVDEFGISTAGGKYVPAVVLRESPFSYALDGLFFVQNRAETQAKAEVEKNAQEEQALASKKLDELRRSKANAKSIQQQQAAVEKASKKVEAAEGQSFGLDSFNSEVEVKFAPVFFSDPQHPVDHPSVNPSVKELGAGFGDPRTTVKRFIDTSTIGVQDIITEDIGRSDADTVNLIDTTGFSLNGQNAPHIYRPFTPFLHPQSIIRNGLRIKNVVSKFSRVVGSDTTSTVKAIVQQVARWNMLMDMWCLHNTEYLSGTFTLRGRPDIRVGYRLDVPDRNECFYVESVNQEWTFTGTLTTTVGVSRGQPLSEDTRLLYVPPVNLSFLGPISGPLAEARGNRVFEPFVVSKGFEVKKLSAYNNSVKKNVGWP